MACDRQGCEHVMCDRYSDKYGYICNYCFEDLINLGVGVDITAFMEGRIEPPDRGAAESYFGEIFK